MRVTKNPAGHTAIMLAGLLGLASCSSSGSEGKETAAEMAMSVRLNSLEERVAYLENAINHSPTSATTQKSTGYIPEENGGNSFGLSNNSPDRPSDQQEYERQVQALCASKGVDCTK